MDVLRLGILISSASSALITFRHSDSALIISNPGHYESAWSDTNGALLYLLDGGNQTVISGSTNGCMWDLDVAEFAGRSGAAISACDFSSNNSTFSWVWAADEGQLSLAYGVNASAFISVTIQAYPAVSHLDWTLQFGDTGGFVIEPLSRLTWPAVLFNGSQVSSAYIPFLPGLALTTSFFQRRGSYGFLYPDVGSWASFGHVALTVESSNNLTGFALYDLSGPDVLLPHVWRYVPAPNGGVYSYQHEHPVNVSAGCSPSNAAWPPCAVGYNGTITRRFLIGSANPWATLTVYAAHNGMVDPSTPSVAAALLITSSHMTGPAWEQGTYPTLLDKGSQVNLDFPLQWFASPLIKLDARVVGMPFSDYASRVYPYLPNPSIAHYAAYMAGGHDHNYPDFLPPDAALNSTTCDFRDSASFANAMGLLTMPYLNPTWWSLTSETLSPLNPAQLDDVTALNSTYQPSIECYGPNCGTATTPYSPFVQARIDKYMMQFSTNYSISRASSSEFVAAGPQPDTISGPCNDSTAVMPFTFLFEDQLGARYPKVDFSPHAKGMGPLAYARGWQDHINRYAAVGLHSEQGVDRHARSIFGYFGSILAGLAGGPCGQLLESDWLPMPLVSAVLRRHVTLNQHDLSGEDMAISPQYLAWDAAHGLQLSFDASDWNYMDRTWMQAVGDMQNVALGRYTHYTLTGWKGAPSAMGTAALMPLGMAPSYLQGVDTVSWSLFSTDGQPLLQRWYSSTYTVLVNWANASTAAVTPPAYGLGSASTAFDIGPGGLLVYGQDGDVVAGYIQGRWNDVQLSALPHTLVEDRTCSLLQSSGRSAVCVFHPTGADTSLTVLVNADWAHPVQAVTGTPASRNGTIVGPAVPVTLSPDGSTMTFTWARTQPGGVDAEVYILVQQ